MALVERVLIEVGQSTAVNQVQLVVLVIAGLSTVDEQVTVKDDLSMVRAQKADEKVDGRRDIHMVDLVTVDLVTVDLVTVDLVTVDLAVNRVIDRVFLVEKVGLFDQKAKANRIDVKLL
jgi:hypothetical protein